MTSGNHSHSWSGPSLKIYSRNSKLVPFAFIPPSVQYKRITRFQPQKYVSSTDNSLGSTSKNRQFSTKNPSVQQTPQFNTRFSSKHSSVQHTPQLNSLFSSTYSSVQQTLQFNPTRAFFNCSLRIRFFVLYY